MGFFWGWSRCLLPFPEPVLPGEKIPPSTSFSPIWSWVKHGDWTAFKQGAQYHLMERATQSDALILSRVNPWYTWVHLWVTTLRAPVSSKEGSKHWETPGLPADLGFLLQSVSPILPCPSWCQTQGFFTGTELNASFRRFSYLLSQAAGGDESSISPAELFSYPVTLSAEKVPLISRWKLLLLLHPCQKGLNASCQQTTFLCLCVCTEPSDPLIISSLSW